MIMQPESSMEPGQISLRSLRQLATLTQGHGARRSASLLNLGH